VTKTVRNHFWVQHRFSASSTAKFEWKKNGKIVEIIKQIYNHPAHCTVDENSLLHNLVNKHKLTHNFSQYVYFFSLHVSGDYVPIRRRNKCIYTTLGICHSVWMTVWYRYSHFSWWWTHSRPKHVEKRNKHTKKNCAPSWLYLQDYTWMHGQQNIKFTVI